MTPSPQETFRHRFAAGRALRRLRYPLVAVVVSGVLVVSSLTFQAAADDQVPTQPSSEATASADPTTSSDPAPSEEPTELPTASEEPTASGEPSEDPSDDAPTTAATSEPSDVSSDNTSNESSQVGGKSDQHQTAAAAAAASGCGYATTGIHANTICWLDMTSYNDTQARTPAGQPMTATLPGDYELSYTIKTAQVPGRANAAVESRTTPIETRFAFGTEGYAGIPDKPSLYSFANGAVGLDVTLSDIVLEDPSGTPVTSYAFVATDTEDNVGSAAESLRWTSDKNLNLLETLYPQGTKGCKPAGITGLGTTTVTCVGTGGPSTLASKSTSILVSADAPSTFALRWQTNARSGIAFGVRTSSIEVIKKVDGRADRTDSFDVSLSSVDDGTLDTATTNTANTATTGPIVVIPPVGNQTFTLTDAATPGSGTDLADYTHTWSCTRNGAPDPGLPSGEHTSVGVTVGTGDGVVCTVTNRSLTFDGGDASASYGTLLTGGGPRHSVSDYDATTHTSSLMIGTHVDTELDGAPSTAADGDDTTATDDEDGASSLSLPPGTATGVDVAVTNTTGGPATLHGWVDANDDGAFQASEQASTPVPNGATSATLSWSGLTALPVGSTRVVRLRLTSATLTDNAGTATLDERSGGAAPDGEVEDYRASVAQAPLQCNRVYSLQGADPRNLWAVNTASGNQTSVGSFSISGAIPNLDGLGISADGEKVYGVLPANTPGTGRSIYLHTRATGATTMLGAGVASAQVTHGAVNPANGIYYYGGMSGNQLNVYGFDPATSTSLGRVAAGNILNGGTNGDWAFDTAGRLYVVAGASANNVLSVVDQAIPATTQATPLAITATRIATNTAAAVINGIAFGGDGHLYIASGTVVYQVNPTSGATVSSANLSRTGSVDLASCAVPSTLEVRKSFPDGRAVAADQATLSISGGGLATAVTASTAGADQGIQGDPTETAGPVPALNGTTFTISETGGATGAAYLKSWACVDTTTGTTLASGTGTTGTVTLPAGAATVSALCTFTNALHSDLGDAPATYGTALADNGPSHKLVGYNVTTNTGAPMLGAKVDAETDGVPSPAAGGDDAAGIDDEDGVAFNTDVTTPGRLETVYVAASAAGFLNGWIDYNRDGDFDAAEQLFTDKAVTAGVNRLTYTVPTGPAFVQGASFARFRLTSAAGQATSPTGPAPNGEVEDYARQLFDPQATALDQCPVGSQPQQVTIVQNPSFETRTGNFVNTSANSINFATNWYDAHPSGGQYYVFSPTFDSGPAESTMPFRAGADGYGFLGGHTSSGTVSTGPTNDAGEGATNTLVTPLAAGTPYVGFFSIGAGGHSRNGSGYLRLFGVDNKSIGSLPASGVVTPTATNQEALAQTPTVAPATAGTRAQWQTATFTFTPAKSWPFLRVEARNATPGNNGTTGGQTWMSFDDFHLFACNPAATDFGDAEDTYGTTVADDGPRHLVTGYDADADTAALMLGDTVDGDVDGVPGPDADGDDTTDVADEDGVAGGVLVTPGQATTVSVSATNSTGTVATLAGWIDRDNDLIFEATERATASVPASSGAGTYTLTFPAGASTTVGQARFRLFPGTVANPLPTGAAAGGEVEDYPVTVPAPTQCDGSAYAVVGTGTTPPISHLIKISPDGTSVSLVQDEPYDLNALGFNQLDGYLYALRRPAGGVFNQLVRINPVTGAVQLLGGITGAPASGFVALAAMNGDHLYLNAADTLYTVDVTTRRVVDTQAVVGGWPSPTPADIAFNPLDGKIYGYAWVNATTGRILKLDPATGVKTLTSFTQPSTVVSGFGAQWFDGAGRLYGIANSTQELWQISGVFTATPTIVKTADPGGPTGGGDGASCTPPDLLKDVQPSVIAPGGTVTYTYTASNPTISPLNGVTISDLMPDDAAARTYVAGSVTVVDGAGGPVTGWSAAIGNTNRAGDTLTVSDLDIPQGGRVVVSVQVKVSATAPNGTVNNQATLSDLPGAFGDTPSDYPPTGAIDDPTPLEILSADFGDAPATFGTAIAANGAQHVLVGYDSAAHTTPLMLGATVDPETDGAPGAAASGDDLAGVDDEDALPLLALTPGATTASATVPVVNGTGAAATLYGWIDANGNGTFQAVEAATATVPAGATSATLSWTGLPAAVDGAQPVVRLRLTSATLTDIAGTAALDERSQGSAPDGEVEDSVAAVAAALPNDCVNPLVETFGAGSGRASLPAGQTTYGYAATGAVNDGSYALVPGIDTSYGGWWHTGPDHTIGDTNGRAMLVNADFVAGKFFSKSFTGLQVGSKYDFSAWITNANNAGSAIVPNIKFRVVDPVSGAVLASFDTGNLPNQMSLIWTRYALSFTATQSTVRLELVNNAPGGGGNDLALDDIGISPTCEYGDAPNSYGTLLASGGPVHGMGAPHLGATVDREGDGQPTAAADGDDVAGSDDEDGVEFNPALGYPNATIRTGTDPVTLQPVVNHLEVDASAAGFASVWVDWNEDGDFLDPGERVADATPVSAGDNDLSFPGAANPADIRTYVRVRYSTDTASLHTPGGSAPDGEVEDYQVLVERLVATSTCTPTTDPYYALTAKSITEHLNAGQLNETARYPAVTVVKGVAVDLLAAVTAGRLNVNGFVLSGDDPAWVLSSTVATVRLSFVVSGTTTPVNVNTALLVNDMDRLEVAAFQKVELEGSAIPTGSKVVITQDANRYLFSGTVTGNSDPRSRFQVWFKGKSGLNTDWKGSGFAIDGDGSLPPSCDDYGDAPDSYKTLLDSDGPHHRVTADLRLGAAEEIDGDGQPTAAADGDDLDLVDDEDGVATPLTVTKGAAPSVDVNVTNTGAAPATLAGWIDLDKSGTFDANERATTTVAPLMSGGTVALTWSSPVTTSQATYARFRLYPGVVADPLPTGAATGGEVEDYPVTTQVPSLTVAKTSDATASSKPGDTVHYTVTLTNTGSGAFTAGNPARLVDDLTGVLDDAIYQGDASATVDGNAVGSPTYTEPRISWSGPLAAGKSVVVTYSVVFKGGGDGHVRNTAFAPPTPTPGPTPDCSTPGSVPCDTELFELPKLSVTKTANRSQLPAVGQTIVYTVKVTNTGLGAFTPTHPATFADDLSAVLDDTQPLTAGNITATSGTASFSSPTLSWSGSLTAGQTATITYTLTYTGAGDQQLDNHACIPAAEATDPADTCRTVSVPGSGLRHHKSVDPASGTSVDVGQVLTYTLTFENVGPVAADVDTSDDLSDVLDDAQLIGAPVAGAGLTATIAGTDLEITGSVPAGQTRTVTYQVGVRAWADQGDHLLANVLACEPGEPAGCAPETTSNPVRHLTLDKTSDATVDSKPGDQVTYTITATNDGTGDWTSTDPATLVDDLTGVLDDAVYAGIATASSGATSYAAPRLTWTGALAAGDSVTIEYTVTLTGGGDGHVDNVVWQPGNPGNPGPTPDCTATQLPCAEHGSDLPKLTIKKTSNRAQLPAAGQKITYTVTVTNPGPGDYTAAHPATFSDDLADVLDDATFDAGSITASTGSASLNGTKLDWSGALASGQSATVTYTLTYQASGNLVVDNHACIPVEEAKDPADTCRTVHTPGSGLRHSKSVSPATGTSVSEGQVLTYTLTFENVGPAAATVNTFDDLSDVADDAVLDTGSITVDAGLNATPNGAGDRIDITGTVPTGATLTVTYQVTVKPYADQGNHLVTNALACEPGDPQPCDPTSTTNPVRHLSVTKSSDATVDSKPGDTVSYTVRLVNDGAGDYTAADPATLVDDLSGVLDDATFDGVAHASAGPDPTYAAPRITWAGPLAVGDEVRVTYEVVLKGGGDGVVRNVAWQPVDPGNPGPTPDCAVSPRPCDTESFDLPKLVVSKTANRTQLTATGQTVTYTIVVTNPGPGDYTAAHLAAFSDDLSDVVDDAVIDPASVTATSGTATYAGALLVWTGVLPATGSATITYTATYLATGNHVLANTACVPVDEAQTPASRCDSPPPIAGAQLTHAKSVAPASGTPVQAGQTLTYTLTFINSGTVPADVATSDDLSGVLDDATLDPASVTAGAGLVATPSGNSLNVTGTVPAGATRTVTYQVTVKPFAQQGDHVIANALACEPGDPVPCAPETTSNPVAHLVIDKSSNRTVDSKPGDTITYTVTAHNDGPGDFTAGDPASVVDDLTGVLDDATYGNDAAADRGAAPTYAAPRITWSGALASNDTVTITYTVVLKGGGDGVVRNVAWQPVDPGNPGPAPDCAVSPRPCGTSSFDLPKLTVAKSANRADLPATGQDVTYTVVVTNPGPGDYTAAHPATFSDDLSDVLDDATPGAITATVGSASITGTTLSWSGVLTAHQAATITYTVTYRATGDHELDNTACVPASEAQVPAEACDTVSVPGSGLVHHKSVDPASGTAVEVGDVLTYTLTFDNTAGKTAATVDTSDDLSAVLDDATLDAASITAGAGLNAVASGNSLDVTGSVPAGATRTVTYQVTVKPFAQQGDHLITNALACEPGEPAPCAPETTTNPVRHVILTKVKTSPVAPDTGDQVTYTLTVTNDGTGDWTAGDPASVVDDLTDVVDDATWDDTATASGGTVSYTSPTLTWSGALAHAATVTITYTVTVTNLGDHRLANTASVPGCQLPECTPPPVVTPLPHVVPTKTSTPAAGAPVQPGDQVTYTLTWTNDGLAPGVVDSTDDLTGVLDDADVVTEPTSSDPAVTATRTGTTLRVVGPIAVGDTVTVTYAVRVKPSGQHGDNNLANVLAQDTPQVNLPAVPVLPGAAAEHRARGR